MSSQKQVASVSQDEQLTSAQITALTPRPPFLIVDGHALIYRAFHAFPPLTDSQGEIVGALYGFLRILLAVLKQVEPAYWAIAFDHPAPTVRKLKYDFYKANRKPMPDELRPQIPLIEEAVNVLGIPVFKQEGIEGDDLIGTLAQKITATDLANPLILTGDRDTFQLVTDRVHVLVPNLGYRRETAGNSMTEYNPALVEQKMLLPPAAIVDYKALAGDASDNISGVPGIGAKTATTLLQQYQTLDAVYAAVDAETLEARPAVITKLLAGRASAYISQELAQIITDVPLDFDPQSCAVQGYDKEKMAKFLANYGFHSLIKLLPQDEFETGVQDALF